MKSVQVTQILCDTIKQTRKCNGWLSADLSRALGKNTSFISQLENQKISTLDADLCSLIFRVVTLPPSDAANLDIKNSGDYDGDDIIKKRSERCEKILIQLKDSLSENEIANQSWLNILDLQIRGICVPTPLLDDMIKEASSLSISLSDLTFTLNSNRASWSISYANEYDAMRENQIYLQDDAGNEGLFIKFHFSDTELPDLFAGINKYCNYIKLREIISVLLYNKQGPYAEQPDFQKLYADAERFLAAHDVTAIFDNNRLLAASEDTPPQRDPSIQAALSSLYDILYTLLEQKWNIVFPAINVFTKNLEMNPSLVLSLMGKDLSGLQTLDKSDTREFVQEFQALILKYQDRSSNKKNDIELF